MVARSRLALVAAVAVGAVVALASPAAAADASVCRAFKVCSAPDGVAWTSVQLFGALDKLVQDLALPGAAADYADVKEAASSVCACAAGSQMLEVKLSLPVPAHLTAPLVAEAVDSFAADDAASAVGHARCLSAPRAALCAAQAGAALQADADAPAAGADAALAVAFRRRLMENLASMPEDVAQMYAGTGPQFGYGSYGADGGYYGAEAVAGAAGAEGAEAGDLAAVKAAGLKWAESAGAAAAAAAAAKIGALGALKGQLLGKMPLFAAEGSCPACNGDCTLQRPLGCAACPGCDRARTVEGEASQGLAPGAVAGIAIGAIAAGFACAALVAAGAAKLVAHRRRQAATLATTSPLLRGF